MLQLRRTLTSPSYTGSSSDAFWSKAGGSPRAWSDDEVPIVDGPSVVVLDPDSYGRHALAHALAARGLRVHVARFLPEALAFVDEMAAVAVVVAENLGAVDGRQVIERLARDSDCVFALRVDGEGRRAEPLDGAHVLGLPWTAAELEAFVTRITAGAPRADGAERSLPTTP